MKRRHGEMITFEMERDRMKAQRATGRKVKRLEQAANAAAKHQARKAKSGKPGCAVIAAIGFGTVVAISRFRGWL